MGSSRNFLAVFSPIFLTADWPRFEWESVVAGDLNNTRGAYSTLLSADRHSPGGRRISRPSPSPYIHAPSRSSWPAANKADDDGQIGAARGGINADAKGYLTMESSNENQ